MTCVRNRLSQQRLSRSRRTEEKKTSLSVNTKRTAGNRAKSGKQVWTLHRPYDRLQNALLSVLKTRYSLAREMMITDVIPRHCLSIVDNLVQNVHDKTLVQGAQLLGKILHIDPHLLQRAPDR